MTPEQAKRLADLLKTKQAATGLSGAEVARRAGVGAGTVSRIERGQIPNPTAKTLLALGRVLGIPESERFAVASWALLQELPTIRPYLRIKYHLPDSAMQEIEAHFAEVARRHGTALTRTTGRPTAKTNNPMHH